MKKYEGLFIFHQPGDDQALEEKVEKARAEIVKQGGTVEATTRMGRLSFARPLRKREFGVYVLIAFTLEPDKLIALQERYRLNEEILRVQIVVAPKAVKAPAKTAEAAAPVAPVIS